MPGGNKLENQLAENEIEITFGPYNDPSLKKIPDIIREQLDQLFNMINVRPKEVIPGLLNLVKKYPAFPVLSNLLYAAYSMADESENAEKVALESFNNFPDYIFAKINYAQVC